MPRTDPLNCVECQAPLHDYEYVPHLKACVLIHIALNVTTDAEKRLHPGELAHQDRVEAQKRNAELGLTAWPPYIVGPPPTATTETPAPDTGWGDKQDGESYQAWQQRRRREQLEREVPPPGKVRCLVCNGLREMYPDCGACGATGWIDRG